MMKTKMSNSTRKHMRTEKARICRETFSVKEQKDKINKLYQGLIKKDENKVVGIAKNKD